MFGNMITMVEDILRNNLANCSFSRFKASYGR